MGDNYLGHVKLNVYFVRLSAVLDIDAGGVAYTEFPPSKINRCSYIIIDQIQECTRTSNK